MQTLPKLVPIGFAFVVTACGAGPYGHSRTYSPLDAEQQALVESVELDPVMADRRPSQWEQKKVSAFGIVSAREDLDNGNVRLRVSLRRLEARNLCSDASEGSCRTTVSERSYGRVTFEVTPTSEEDRAGATSLGVGSLVRAVGKLSGLGNGGDAPPTLTATYYRHWPRQFYVTTAAAASMRR